jgi:hypothetical protein
MTEISNYDDRSSYYATRWDDRSKSYDDRSSYYATRWDEGSTISGTVIPITQQQEGINTLRDLGNEYGTLNQSDKNRLNTIFNSKQPLTEQDRAFLEKEADQLYEKIPQVVNNNARTLLTDGVSNNYNSTYSDAFNDLNKLVSKVDNVFNTDTNDVVADARKALKSLEDGINSNSRIADPFIANGRINPDWLELHHDSQLSFGVQSSIDAIQDQRIQKQMEKQDHIYDIQNQERSIKQDHIYDIQNQERSIKQDRQRPAVG